MPKKQMKKKSQKKTRKRPANKSPKKKTAPKKASKKLKKSTARNAVRKAVAKRAKKTTKKRVKSMKTKKSRKPCKKKTVKKKPAKKKPTRKTAKKTTSKKTVKKKQVKKNSSSRKSPKKKTTKNKTVKKKTPRKKPAASKRPARKATKKTKPSAPKLARKPKPKIKEKKKPRDSPQKELNRAEISRLLSDAYARHLIIEAGGEHALEIVRGFSNNSSDEDISKKMKIKISDVRATLNKLHSLGIVDYTRHKDSETGWFSYFWCLNVGRMQGWVNSKIEEERKNFDFSNGEYYFCPNCGGSSIHEFVSATDFGFKCPVCSTALDFLSEEKAEELFPMKAFRKPHL
ncbi:hypothetical protein GF412_01920 [Candidatus Micrarchaeota archaeon]|nr:hypothetical protein [Candidatus Micrarchaeota archaeon]MBD3417719.1 hypothetical protein [Candidatus Micrarchaeota archaeon]